MIRIGIALVVALSTLVLGQVGVASARSSGWHTWSQPVYLTGQLSLASGLCADWRVQATMKVTARQYSLPQSPAVRHEYWKNMSLSNVTFDVFTYDRCGSYTSPRTRVGVDKLTIGGRIYGREKEGCSYNPRLSVSAPFGVSLSVAPTCGGSKVRTGYASLLNYQPKHKVSHAAITTPGRAALWAISDDAYSNYDRGVHNVCLGYTVGVTAVLERSGSVHQYSKSATTRSCWNMYRAK